jgi:hypothetical protein
MASLQVTFDSEEVDAALSVWEAMFEVRQQMPDMDKAWNDYGTSAMRQTAAGLGKIVQAAWLTVPEDDQDGICAPFDWEFVPAFLRLVTFGPHGGASIAGTPQEVGKRVVQYLAAKHLA